MIGTEEPFPNPCKKFRDVFLRFSALQLRSSAKDDDIAFVGMNSGERLAFKAARDSHRLNHAQLQRRLTNPFRKSRERL